MKKPKIGDMVIYLYDDIPYPAVITSYFGSMALLFVMGLNDYNTPNANYSKDRKNLHWSWPEEEKPREFHCERCKNPVYGPTEWFETKELIYCENCPENKEKPKECEHQFLGVVDSNFMPIYQECQKCHLQTGKKINEAEELIEKISSVIDKRETPVRSYYRIEDLIKEYKDTQ